MLFFKEKIRYILLVIFIVFFVLMSSWEAFATETQWFSKYEIKGQISVSECDSFCIVNIASIDNIDEVSIQWVFSWTGVIGLAIQNEKWIQAFVQYPIRWNVQLKEKIPLKNVAAQVPGVSLLVFHQWNIKAHAYYSSVRFSILNRLSKQLFTAENFLPSSINARTGKYLWSTSIILIGYWFFILICPIILILTERKRKSLLSLWLILYSIIAMINLISIYQLYFQSAKEYKNKIHYHNMWNYFKVTQDMRDLIWLTNSNRETHSCSYHAECLHHWPFCYYLRTLYMKPCEHKKDPKDAKYIIIYGKQIPENYSDREILYSEGKNYLLK